jgi:hypothetical protein
MFDLDLEYEGVLNIVKRETDSAARTRGAQGGATAGGGRRGDGRGGV